MADLKKQTNKRTGLKATLTKSLGILKQQLENETLNTISIQERIYNIEETLSRYRQVQECCLELIDDQNLQTVIDFETEFEENIIDTLISAKSKLTNFTLPAPSLDTVNQTNEVSGGEQHFYKLPRVEIPTFSGDLTEWMSFIQSYEHSVNVTNIPNTVKFTILRHHLTGEALETIKYFSITDENFPIALQTLKDRYGDADKLVEIYVEKLIDLKQKTDQLSLRQIYNQLLTIVSILENLNIQRDQYAVLLVPMLKAVFSHPLQLKWAKYEKQAKSNPNLQNENRLTLFLAFLKEEIEIIETTRTNSGVTKLVPSHIKGSPLIGQRPTAAFHTGQNFRFGTPSGLPRSTRFYQNTPRMRTPSYNEISQQRYGTSHKLRHQTTAARDNTFLPPCCFCMAKCGKTSHHHPRSCHFAIEFHPGRAKDLINADNRCNRCLGPRATTCCPCTYKCFLCGNSHHTLLCERRLMQSHQPHPNEPHFEVNPIVKTFSALTMSAPQTILPTAAVNVSSPSGHAHTRILLDTGSQRTYVTRALSSEIYAPILRYDFLASEGFGGRKERPKDTEVVSITLESLDRKNQTQIEALVVEKLTSSNFSQFRRDDIKGYEHLMNIKFLERGNDDPIEILIGQDHYWDIVDGEVIRGEKGEPVAMKTIFGHVLSGPSPQCSSNPNAEVGTFFCKGDEWVCKNIEKFWTFESLGINNKEISNDEEAIQAFMSSVQYKEKQYEIGLPWKADHPPLVNNLEKAKARLLRLDHRLQQQPELAKMYNEAMQELIDEKFVEEVTDNVMDEINAVKGREFYLPHRPVLKQGASSYKCRPVFDASAEDMNGVSLNNCLLTGPCLLPHILEILLQFRWWKYGLIGDIKRAFIQISISEKDRDALRFLWKNQIYRFRKVPFGLCCSPYLLNQTIQYHLTNFITQNDQEKANLCEIGKAFYVDDLIFGADSFDDLQLKLSTAYHVLQEAGMTLRNWSCSMEGIQRENRNNYEFEKSNETHVLGLDWNTADDTFKPKIPIWNLEWNYTKRNILSYLAQIYDPLGLLSPLTVQGKLLMQTIWKESFDWDDIVSPVIQALADDFIQNCTKFSTLNFPRSIRPLIDSHDTDTIRSLMVFCDASSKACGAAVYFKQNNYTQLVASKVKVAPLNSKTMSIPRLELISCLIGARMANTIHHIDQYTDLPISFFTDSSVALAWIRAGIGHKTQRELFINNRVKEILTTTQISDWTQIDTNQNPADLLTRNNSINRLNTVEGMNLWMHGPTSDLQLMSVFCNRDAIRTNSLPADQNHPTNKDPVDSSVLLNVYKEAEEDTSHSLFDISLFSDMRKVLKITVYILRFKNRITKAESQYSKTIAAGHLSKQKVPVPLVQELQRAKLFWIKSIQQTHFWKEIQSLKSGQAITKSSTLHDLKPILTEDGLLRSLSRTNLPPLILLPQKDPFVTLLVQEIQANNFHSGINFTLCELRQSFWLIKGRQTVKRVLNECLICKRHSAQPYHQVLAPLPTWRVTQQSPFEVVGMDFCGPFNIRDGKAYILMFSCAVTRACHLELTSDMSTTSSIQGLRRMLSRRGQSKLIVCYNARSFKKLRQKLNSDINFYFIPPYSPWFGGFYERLNSSIKQH